MTTRAEREFLDAFGGAFARAKADAAGYMMREYAMNAIAGMLEQLGDPTAALAWRKAIQERGRGD